MTRLYQITLIFLAPFCVIGGISVFKVVSRVVRASWTAQRVRSSLKLLSVYFVIFMLFSTQFVWEVTDDNPSSISLSQDKVWAFCRVIHDPDIAGAEWLSVHRKNSIHVYANGNTHSAVMLWAYGFIPKEQVIRVSKEPEEIKDDAYVFLNYVNVVRDVIYLEEIGGLISMHNTTFFQLVHHNKNKIYDNGGNIYL